MVKRKGKFAKIALCCALALTMSLTATLGTSPIAEADSVKNLRVSDDFDAEGLNSELWSTSGEGATQKNLNGVLEIKKFAWGDTIAYQKGFKDINPQFLPDNFTLETDVQSVTEGWFGVAFGMPNPNVRYDHENIPAALIIYSNGTPKIDVFKGGSPVAAINMDSAVQAGTWYSFRFDVTKGTGTTEDEVKASTKVEVSVAVKGETPVKVGEYAGFEPNCTFGFFASDTVTQYDNLKLTSEETGFETVTSTFDQNEISYHTPAGGEAGGENRLFRTWSDADKTKTFCGTKKVFAFDGATQSQLNSKTKIAADKDNTTAFEMSFQIDVTKLEAESKLGVSFNLSDSFAETADTDKIWFEALDAGFAIAGTDFAPVEIKSKLSSASEPCIVKFVGRNDKTVAVYVGSDNVATIPGINITGNFAIFAEAAAGQTVDATVDNFELFTYTFIKAEGKAQSIAFEGKKLDGKKGYVDPNEWYLSGSAFAAMGELMFTEAGKDTAFGPNAKYDQFVLKFDVRDVIRKGSSKSTMIGVSVGRETKGQDFFTSQVLGFTTIDGGKMIIETLNMNGQSSDVLACNFWDENQTNDYTVIVVAKNRTVSVYLKNKDDSDFVLDRPVHVVKNVNTYGYVAIAVGEKGNFSIDNFSITPII